jgi:hypothetical protein
MTINRRYMKPRQTKETKHHFNNLSGHFTLQNWKSPPAEFVAVGTPYRKTDFEGWTNVKQRKTSEFPTGNSKTNNLHGR